LKNVPDIADVRVMLEVLATLGTEVERLAPDTWRLTTPEVTTATLDATLCTRIRASILFAGPMLGRVGRVELPPPGGDVIGRRRVDTHFMGLEALGARFEAGDRYVLVADSLEGTEIFLDEQSVTATENIVMAAAAARGTTTILNAASEPHVQGLCRMLVSMGAEIGGIGTNTLRVTGARRL
ncbi:MAG: UDP-N-acetylglucosamine 1-carboxyvinyltransferase, partial [Gemmatimonadetes bacterium]|nr:UDP-N-acetylglucosamine 1-carboxyvinyltransferase [Gemmatimonadota bacterium]